MYSIKVDIFLAALIFALAALLFLGSLVIVLLEAASEAAGRATMKYARSLGRFVGQAPLARLEPHRAVARSRADL